MEKPLAMAFPAGEVAARVRLVQELAVGVVSGERA
jgi:hypothetical protein